MQRSFNSVTITVICFVLILAVLCPLRLCATPQLSPANITAASATDPDKPSSEMNHHIAGIFLIAIGLSVIWSKHDRSRAWLRWLAPILFIAAGLFLAAWSDGEIWPRGNLGWLWLLRHDAEARQHKLYALLLIVFGLVEYVQSTPRLCKPWLKVATPVLCVLGGAALFFHHHSGMAMENAHAMASSGHEAAIALDKSGNCQSATESMPAGPHHHDAANVSHPCPSTLVQAGTSSIAQGHDHALMGSGTNIQRQHAWFAIVGFCVALFKFLHDVARPPIRVPYSLWANSVIVLGILLLTYVE
ncbi:MAG TPA: hypothetical protein VGJ51_08110 [Candidatus Angelobacter sp.]